MTRLWLLFFSLYTLHWFLCVLRMLFVSPLHCIHILHTTVINSSAATKDNKWQSIIDPHHGSDNWYRRHREDYGSLDWIRWRVCILVIVAYIANCSWFILNSLEHFNTWHWVMYWCSIVTYLNCVAIVPLSVFFHILRRVSILDDAIGLKKVSHCIWRLFIKKCVSLKVREKMCNMFVD